MNLFFRILGPRGNDNRAGSSLRQKFRFFAQIADDGRRPKKVGERFTSGI
jgi:hypothetical protein